MHVAVQEPEFPRGPAFQIVDVAEEHRHEDQAQRGGRDQAADHRDRHRRTERRIQGHAERHRQHARGHRDRGHHDRPRAYPAGVDDGGQDDERLRDEILTARAEFEQLQEQLSQITQVSAPLRDLIDRVLQSANLSRHEAGVAFGDEDRGPRDTISLGVG